MFRANESEGKHSFSVAARAVQLAVFAALLGSLASTYLIIQEYRLLGFLLAGSAPIPSAKLETVHQEVGLQVFFALGQVAILLFCTVAFLWLRRRYLASQQSLRRLKMLAHDIMASMDRGIITTDQKGVITSINSAGIHLMAVDFECVGQPLARICSEDVPLVDVYRKVADCRDVVRDCDFSVNRAGRVLRLRTDGHVLKDNRGRALGCVIHLRDVTERMFMEERMRRMERFINLATLASGLHHEIKNPLTALSIHIQLLEESLANGLTGESVDELVGVLKTEVVRLNGVLESFRSFANLQHLTLQPTDALRVVEHAIHLIRPQASEQRVQITLLQPEKELPLVPLDADKFEQAVLNLVINALEAMPEGGKLTIQASVAETGFCVSVQDNGPGIPPEIQRNLFQPYFSTKDKGSGMGLALSEKLINQHGGQINFHSGPEGTTFAITIPLEAKNGSA